MEEKPIIEPKEFIFPFDTHNTYVWRNKWEVPRVGIKIGSTHFDCLLAGHGEQTGDMTIPAE